MSDFTLFLDSVAFRHVEIPDNIKAGGAQALFRHQYPGGARTIDAMGPDDADISWSGMFMDGTAQDRCKQLDVIRRQGQSVVLSWAGYQYLVVVAAFEWDFKRVWQIGYTITLAVVQDETQPQQAAAPDVDSQVGSDALQAAADAGALSDAVAGLVTSPIGALTASVQGAISGAAGALNAAVANVNGALGSVASLVNAPVDVQAAIGAQVGAALGASVNLQGTLNTALAAAGSAARFTGGTSPQAMVAAVTNLKGLSGALAASADCSNVLGRMAINIGQLGK
jgi:hypothetical protein